MKAKKTGTKKLIQGLAGLVVGADPMVEEASRDVRPGSADAAALLFSQAVGMRMVGRWRYSRWWYGLAAEQRATLEAMGAAVGRRLELPEGTSTARVVRLYYAGKGVRPKQVKRELKRRRARA